MLVALTTEKELAAVPPIVTAVAPIKLVPVIVTVDPDTPLLGVNELIVGLVLTAVTVGAGATPDIACQPEDGTIFETPDTPYNA